MWRRGPARAKFVSQILETIGEGSFATVGREPRCFKAMMPFAGDACARSGDEGRVRSQGTCAPLLHFSRARQMIKLEEFQDPEARAQLELESTIMARAIGRSDARHRRRTW